MTCRRSATLVDIQGEFLRLAKGNLRVPHLRLIEADLLKQIPLPDQCIDVAFSVLVLNELPEGRAIILVTHPFFVLYWNLKTRWGFLGF